MADLIEVGIENRKVGLTLKKQTISVIVPVYNVELYLGRCVDSILAQSYRELDVILVDDGSPDNCGVICDQYAEQDPRVTVIHKKNGGLSDARNHGMAVAKGEYVTFVDSDDWVSLDYIETLYSLIVENDADISIGNFQKTSVYPAQIEQNEPVNVKKYNNIQAVSELSGSHGVIFVSAWAKLFKKSLFDNIAFPVGKVHEDDFTSYKLYYNAGQVVFSNKVILFYWQREDSITGSRSMKGYKDKLEASSEKFEFFKGKKETYLMSLAGRSLFHNFIHYEKALKGASEVEYSVDRKSLHQSLRQTQQSLAFKLFYEIYFISPSLGWLIYKKIIQPLLLKHKY